MSGPETPYVETEALLAVLNEDEGRAKELLARMWDGEVARFSLQVKHLAELCLRDMLRRVQEARAGLQLDKQV